MKLSDYIVQFIVEQGIKHSFVISGGAIVHTIDSVRKHPGIDYICTQHEQAAGAAADGYSRVNGKLGVAMTTSGPGATNLMTSVCNAYFDSIPVLFICGQVASFRLKPSENLRQKGFQETDILSIYRSVTKYAAQIKKPDDIRYELEKAVYLAKSGRPGPVVLDIPDDFQRVDIDPAKLRSFTPPVEKKPKELSSEVKKFINLFSKAERPILILGAGIRVGKVEAATFQFAKNFHLPFVLTWGAMDLVPYDEPLNMGGLGVCGPRSGNFAVQNSDLIIAMGTRLSSMITGGKQNLFAPSAIKVMVDIDGEELKKFTANDFSLDLAIEADLRDLFAAMKDIYTKLEKADRFTGWRAQISEWRQKYPICPPEYYERKERVDAHVFIKTLSKSAQEGDIILGDTGGNLAWTMQAFEVKKNQRIFSAWNHSPMGYSLPASVGAAFAAGRDILCLTGDGGIMMSLEELGTIRRHDLPVKIFIFNNRGHGIQRQTVDTWLNSQYACVDHATGLYFPDFQKIAEAFKLPYLSIENHDQLSQNIEKVLTTKGPVLCDVQIAESQRIVPMLKFGAGLEDLDPKLPPAELEKIMSVSRQKTVKAAPQEAKSFW